MSRAVLTVSMNGSVVAARAWQARAMAVKNGAPGQRLTGRLGDDTHADGPRG